MRPKRSGDAGLSLIEVLVSLAIFAVIGVAGLAVLDAVARTGERTEGRLERLADIDRAFLVIRRDLAQMTSADVTLDEAAMTFVRTQAQTSLKLSYLRDETVLIRQIDVPSGPPVGQGILTGISTVQWRLLDRLRNWHSVWPPVGSEDPGRPLAAELTLEILRAEFPELQSVTRLIVLPAGQGQ